MKARKIFYSILLVLISIPAIMGGLLLNAAEWLEEHRR